MTLTSQRLKAMRLADQVREHGGFLLLQGSQIVIYRWSRLPERLVTAISAHSLEMGRFIRYSHEPKYAQT